MGKNEEEGTYHPQKDQSGNTMSKLQSSPQYRNNGGGAAFGPRKSLIRTTGLSSQSNMSSKSGSLPGYHLKSCKMPHKVNISLVWMDFLNFSTCPWWFRSAFRAVDLDGSIGSSQGRSCWLMNGQDLWGCVWWGSFQGRLWWGCLHCSWVGTLIWLVLSWMRVMTSGGITWKCRLPNKFFIFVVSDQKLGCILIWCTIVVYVQAMLDKTRG